MTETPAVEPHGLGQAATPEHEGSNLLNLRAFGIARANYAYWRTAPLATPTPVTVADLLRFALGDDHG